MSDFENRLSEMLAERAEAATGADDLAGAATRRHSRRRTTRVVAAGASVAVTIVAVPIGLGALSIDGGDDGGGGGVANQPGPVVQGLPADWRWESFRNVEFAVPPEWGHGSLSQWCVSSFSHPVVERPGTVATAVACPTPYGYGVLVTDDETTEGGAPDPDDAANFPAGAAVRAATFDGITVTAIARSADVADTVIAFTMTNPGPDYYGCEAEVRVPALGDMSGGDGFSRDDPIALCRYQVGVDGANLVDSESISGRRDLDRLWEAFDSARPGTGPDSGPDTCSDWPESQVTLLRSGGRDLAWVHYDGCGGHGIDLGGTTYTLNEQVTYWALPRGGFAVDGSVPLPKEARP